MGKRILVVTDPHSGHRSGLTPPAYQQRPVAKSSVKRNKFAAMQSQNWQAWKKLLRKYQPFDMMFHLGDAIDGTGFRSGGTELITTSLEEQVDMAVDVCNSVRMHGKKGFKIYGVHGTPYHTASGDGDDWDSVLAEQAGWESIGSHEWIDVNGCVFDLKHKVGSSSIPHGRHTAMAKEKLWNQLWADGQPQANVVLRGHVHYHSFCGGPGWLAMTLPALQGAGSKFGARQCSGTVDWGVTVFDVDNKGQFDWTCDTVQFKDQVAKAVRA
jgi:hypothetical protein